MVQLHAPATVCTRDTTRCADARLYITALRPCCRSHVVGITRAIVQTLTTAGIRFWADYGTLLGAVRNPLTTWADYPWLEPADGPIAPGIVPHDKDGDLGISFREWGKATGLIRAMAQRHRFDLVMRPHRASMKVRLSRANHTNVDLFFWHERPDGTMYRRLYAAVDKCKGKEFHRDLLYPLSSVEYEGMTLPAPRDPEAFLEMRYGPDWRTPIAANNDGVPRD